MLKFCPALRHDFVLISPCVPHQLEFEWSFSIHVIHDLVFSFKSNPILVGQESPCETNPCRHESISYQDMFPSDWTTYVFPPMKPHFLKNCVPQALLLEEPGVGYRKLHEKLKTEDNFKEISLKKVPPNLAVGSFCWRKWVNLPKRQVRKHNQWRMESRKVMERRYRTKGIAVKFGMSRSWVLKIDKDSRKVV